MSKMPTNTRMDTLARTKMPEIRYWISYIPQGGGYIRIEKPGFWPSLMFYWALRRHPAFTNVRREIEIIRS